jgi:FecR protein
MRNGSALVATAAASVLLLATTLLAQDSDATSSSSPGVSKVRIVRLSEVKGHVQMDRNIDRGFEPAIANMPIVEKSRLQTGDGVAEIEFEDNSTLRVAPDSIVEFPRLERLADGGTVSTVHLVQGMAYVTLIKGRNNEFHLLFGEQNLALPTPSHVRLQLNGTEANLAVFDGSVRIEGTSGMMDIPKKKTVTFDMLEHQQPKMAKDVLPEPYDSWDESSTGYHAKVANASAFNGSPYSYGLNDMQYYGNFVDTGGCGGGAGGMMWRPYFASAAWDPYANGAFAYYGGAGYSWVSPYPWGWTPYHSGSWNYCPGTGWGWMPGGSWNGLNNMASVMHYQSIGGGGTRLPTPIHPPRTGEPTLVPVNTKPLVRSGVASSQSFVFRKDSAGLGVPRDSFGKLEKVSQHTDSRGEVNQHIYLAAPASAMPNGRVTNTAIMAGSIHRGSPPPASSSTYEPSMAGSSPSGRSSGPSAPSMPSASAPSHASGGPSSSGGSGSARSH